MKKRQVFWLGGLSIVVILSVLIAYLKPVAMEYIRPTIYRVLKEEINGQITYNRIDMRFMDVVVDDVHIIDVHGHKVADIPKIEIGWSPWAVLQSMLTPSARPNIINSIYIERPTLYLLEEGEKGWNIETLFPASKPQEKRTLFRGIARVKQGTVHVETKAGDIVSFTELDALLDAKEAPIYRGTLQGMAGKDRMDTTFSWDMDTNTGDVFVKADYIHASLWEAFLPRLQHISLTKADMNHVQLTIKKRDDDVAVYGSLQAKDVSVKYDDRDVNVETSFIRFDGRTAHLTMENGHIGEYAISHIDMALNYQDDILHVEKGLVTTPSGTLELRGYYNMLEKRYHMVFLAKHMDVSLVNIWHPLPEPVSGYVDGSLIFSNALGKEGRIEASWMLENGRYGNYEVPTWEGYLEGAGDHYVVPYTTLSLEDGIVEARVEWQGDAVSWKLLGKDVPTSYLAQFYEVPASGTVNITAQGEGSLSNPMMAMHIAGGQGKVGNLSYQSLAAEANYQNHHIDIQKAGVLTKDGYLNVQGTFSLEGEGTDASVHAKHIRIEDVVYPFSSLPVTGWMDGDILIKGSLKNPNIEGDVHAWEGSLYDEIISDAKVHFQYADQVLTIDQMNFLVYDAFLTGKGSIQKEALDFTLEGSSIDIARWTSVFHLPLEGLLDVKGRLTGTLHSPIFESSFTGKNIGINHTIYEEATGEIYFDPHVLYLKEAKFKQGDGAYTFNGAIRIPSGVVFGEATAENTSVSSLIQLFDVPIHNLDGKLHGRLTLDGKWNSPNVHVEGKVLHTAIRGEDMGESQIDATLKQQNIGVKSLKIPVGTGFLAMKGTADLRGEANLQLAASHVPLMYVMALVGQDIPITGNLDGFINITGKTLNPKVQLTSTISDLTYHDVKVDHVYALATMQSGVIQVNQVLAERGPYKAKLYGKVPLAALRTDTEIANGRHADVDLRVDMNEADLGIFPLFVPWITQGEGEVDGSIHITGPLHDIHVDGGVSVAGGTLSLLDVKHPLQNIEGKLLFKGQEASLDVHALMGKGDASVQGSASWGKEKSLAYEAHMDLNDLDVQSPIWKGPLRASFAIVQNEGEDRPLIKGTIDLSGDEIEIPLTVSDTAMDFNPYIDITVGAQTPVRLYNSLLFDITATGEAHFTGTLASPHGEGRFVSTSGMIKYLNNRFQVKEASASFQRIGSFLPLLDVKADTTVSDYEVGVQIKGPVENMELSVSSNPSLSEQQIISLLTVRNVSFSEANLGQEALNTLLAAGIQRMVFDNVGDVIKNALGVDRLAITNNYLDPYATREKTGNANNTDGRPLMYYSIEVSKEILPHLMVNVGTGLNYNLSRFGIEYKVGPHLGINAWMTTDHNQYVGAQYRLRF